MGRGAFAKEPWTVVKGLVPSLPFSNHPLTEWSCRGGKGHRDAEAWRRGGAAASHCW